MLKNDQSKNFKLIYKPVQQSTSNFNSIFDLIFSHQIIQLNDKMDFNNLLLSALLLPGRYDTRTVHRNQVRVFMNYFLSFLQFFLGLKLFIIILVPWESKILFYLIEFYLINSSVQKVFFVAVANVHLHIGFLYLYWNYLAYDPKRMQCLNMFFIPDTVEFSRRYDLEMETARKFVKRAYIYKILVLVNLSGLLTVFCIFTLRCLVVSYWTIPIDHFLFIACPMAVLTLLGYISLGHSFLTTYLLALLTMEFLVLRASNVADKIRKRFRRIAKYRTKFKQVVLLKNKKDTMNILTPVNDIVKEFSSANNIFDHAISPTIANSLFGMLIYPVFLFLNLDIFLKVIIVILYVFVLTTCIIISVFNDSFISKVNSFVVPERVNHLLLNQNVLVD